MNRSSPSGDVNTKLEWTLVNADQDTWTAEVNGNKYMVCFNIDDRGEWYDAWANDEPIGYFPNLAQAKAACSKDATTFPAEGAKP